MVFSSPNEKRILEWKYIWDQFSKYINLVINDFVLIFLVELSTVIWCCVSFLILFQNYWSESAGSKVT